MQWGPNFIEKCGPHGFTGVQIFQGGTYFAVKYVPGGGSIFSEKYGPPEHIWVGPNFV